MSEADADPDRAASRSTGRPVDTSDNGRYHACARRDCTSTGTHTRQAWGVWIRVCTLHAHEIDGDHTAKNDHLRPLRWLTEQPPMSPELRAKLRALRSPAHEDAMPSPDPTLRQRILDLLGKRPAGVGWRFNDLKLMSDSNPGTLNKKLKDLLAEGLIHQTGEGASSRWHLGARPTKPPPMQASAPMRAPDPAVSAPPAPMAVVDAPSGEADVDDGSPDVSSGAALGYAQVDMIEHERDNALTERDELRDALASARNLNSSLRADRDNLRAELALVDDALVEQAGHQLGEDRTLAIARLAVDHTPEPPWWLVWCPTGSRPPSYRHLSRDLACAEADRLSERAPGHTFFVLGASDEFHTPPVRTVHRDLVAPPVKVVTVDQTAPVNGLSVAHESDDIPF